MKKKKKDQDLKYWLTYQTVLIFWQRNIRVKRVGNKIAYVSGLLSDILRTSPGEEAKFDIKYVVC